MKRQTIPSLLAGAIAAGACGGSSAAPNTPAPTRAVQQLGLAPR